MKIESITLSNFRCFGAEPTTISLTDTTALVGPNGSGKTALLIALSRLFGLTIAERRLHRDDFHVETDEGEEQPKEISLFIEVKIAFPELDGAEGDDSAVASCFHHMLISQKDTTPYCRIRLEGTLTRTNTLDGEIEEKTCWVVSAAEKPTEKDKKPLKPNERERIHVVYVPAQRDPAKQLRNISGTILARLLNSVVWTDESKTTIQEAADSVKDALQTEPGLQLLHEKLKGNWTGLNERTLYSQPKLRFLTGQLQEILRQAEMTFSPSESGANHPVHRLSDGQRSLFYFSLICTLFDIERHLELAYHAKEEKTGLEVEGVDLDKLDPPALTIFAIEEPENHLAPHYLGRIMSMLQAMASTPSAQVVISSHCASILGRLDPRSVRYFRLNADNCAVVKEIVLPDESDEQFKFVKEAVRAFPELYFARLVVLGEGDTEELVIPRFAETRGIPIDSNFISIVPLGGRFVHHFWRLLSDLEIPHITLLDLDLDRREGGWSRIKYAQEQLLEIGKPATDVLRTKLSDGEFEAIAQDDWERKTECANSELKGWLNALEVHNVFFSAPLDLDLLMLSKFPDAYQSLKPAGGGPRIPKKDPELSERLNAASKTVLGEEGVESDAYQKLRKFFPWYSYLFLGKGKPITHVQALAVIEAETLKANIPKVLSRLLDRVENELSKTWS